MQIKVIHRMIRFCCLLACFAVGSRGYAQRTLLDVKVDSAAILIGEQTVLHLTLTTDPNKNVQLLIPRDTLMSGVEILALPKADSSVIENNRLLVKQDILVTSFDSSLYLLPPFIAVDGSDTIRSNQVALKVSTIPVNVDKPDEFYDIRVNWRPPFVIADYYAWIFGVLIGLFLICVAGYVLRRLRNKKSLIVPETAKTKLPPYEQAILELDQIKEQKLWQQGRNKEYHTEITDTLRRYMADRFDLSALEMTSDEILDRIRKIADADSVYDNLRQILKLADMVKFAKWSPLPDENNLSLVNAYLFVNQTKKEEMVQPDQADEAKLDEPNQSTAIREEK